MKYIQREQDFNSSSILIPSDDVAHTLKQDHTHTLHAVPCIQQSEVSYCFYCSENYVLKQFLRQKCQNTQIKYYLDKMSCDTLADPSLPHVPLLPLPAARPSKTHKNLLSAKNVRTPQTHLNETVRMSMLRQTHFIADSH